MSLSKRLKDLRTDRPDEWLMDDLANEAEFHESLECVKVKWWQQDTLESGRWVCELMPRYVAEEFVVDKEQGEILDFGKHKEIVEVEYHIGHRWVKAKVPRWKASIYVKKNKGFIL